MVNHEHDTDSLVQDLSFALLILCLLFQYDITIEENALHSQLVQIRVIDLDEEFSDNWKAIIFFISGNEGNWFEIEMNERTNVGTLKVVKVWYNYPKSFVLLVFSISQHQVKMILAFYKLVYEITKFTVL